MTNNLELVYSVMDLLEDSGSVSTERLYTLDKPEEVKKILNVLLKMRFCTYVPETDSYMYIKHNKKLIQTETEPILAVIDDTIALEALDDFLVVQEDKFRTGYECKSCDGLGHTTELCTKCKGTKTQVITDLCSQCNGTGRVNDLRREIGEPTEMVKTKQCKDCYGNGKVNLGNIEKGLNLCNACVVMNEANTSGGYAAPCGFTPCSICKGRGVALVVPQESLRRPNSGIVRSTGPKVASVKCGDRVMYSNHTGYEVYFKRNLKFRQMREHEVMARIHGVGELHKALE